MAKAQASRKNRSAGSWNNKFGARPGLGIDPFTGIQTWKPIEQSDRRKASATFTFVIPAKAKDGKVEFSVVKAKRRSAFLGTNPVNGLPQGSTVSDIGFYGRPKSNYRSHLFNRIFTGGMSFPEAETTIALQNGEYKTVPVLHDEHRPAARKERKAERQARYLATKKTKERHALLETNGFSRDGIKRLLRLTSAKTINWENTKKRAIVYEVSPDFPERIGRKGENTKPTPSPDAAINGPFLRDIQAYPWK